MQHTLKSWQEATHEATRFTDRLGRGLDPGIRDTVIALNMLGVSTTQSCEGHLDHGRPYPWVTFDSAEAKALFQQSGVAFANEQFEDAHALKHRAEAEQAYDQRKVIEALTAFYATFRQVPQDRMLIVYARYAGTSILEPQGAMCLIGQSHEVQTRKLAEYQAEMHTFTTFLKRVYFHRDEESGVWLE